MDFTNCQINKLKIYGGANGNKIGIIYNNENYMLKFPPNVKKNKNLSYVNSSINEDVACKIFKSAGINVQETMLGTYNVNGEIKVVVACKDLEKEGFRLKDFAFLKNTIITSENQGYGTELKDIIETIETQELVDVNALKSFFWDMFILDALLGNFDRHNGNWGFLINNETKEVKISNVYDCGSCLYPQIDEELMKKVLSSKDEMLNRVYEYPTSAIKYEGKKINYVDFIKQTKYKECGEALEKILNKIDIKVIEQIIDDTPYISDVQKEFYKTMIKLRIEVIREKGMI